MAVRPCKRDGIAQSHLLVHCARALKPGINSFHSQGHLEPLKDFLRRLRFFPSLLGAAFCGVEPGPGTQCAPLLGFGIHGLENSKAFGKTSLRVGKGGSTFYGALFGVLLFEFSRGSSERSPGAAQVETILRFLGKNESALCGFECFGEFSLSEACLAQEPVILREYHVIRNGGLGHQSSQNAFGLCKLVLTD